jgi:hypothetical protein
VLNQQNKQLEAFGQQINPVTGQVEVTPQGESARSSSYIAQMQGQGDNFDYQGEINKVMADNDTTNDWKIPLLKQMREAKVQQKLQTEVAMIGQYSNDYQAEINRRTAVNENDPMIPYLRVARATKIANMKNDALSKADQQKKDALAIWKEVGVATQSIADILGIPVGTKTTDYIDMINNLGLEQQRINIAQQNADTAEKNATTKASDDGMTATQAKNKYISDASSYYKSESTSNAIKYLLEDADALIKDVGPSGYKQIWDLALGEAVKRGDKGAQAFTNYFKAPKQAGNSLVSDIMSKYGTDINSLLAD